MQPLFAVHNNVSLLSVTIAPSTFLAALVLVFVFVSLYLAFYLPRLPSLPNIFGSRRRQEQQPKPRVVELEDDDSYSHGYSHAHALSYQKYYHHPELYLEGWRQRQLPPLPEPRLLRERGETDEDLRELVLHGSRSDKDRAKKSKEKQKERERPRLLVQARDKTPTKRSRLSLSPKKKKDKEREREQELEQEREQEREREQEQKRRSPAKSPFPDPFVRSRQTDLEFYARHSPLDDDAGDDIKGHESDGDAPAGIDAETWGAFGRFAARFRADPSATTTFGYPSTHSGFLETDSESLDDSVSAGGYSPPAWRRLENGDRSSGFWRACDNILGSPTMKPTWPSSSTSPPTSPLSPAMPWANLSRDWSPALDSADEDVLDPDIFSNGDELDSSDDDDDASDVLARAMRIRLPGSMSPDKERSPAAEAHPYFSPNLLRHQDTMYADSVHEMNPTARGLPFEDSPENYIRFAVRAEVQQRTEPIDAAINFVRGSFRLATKSWFRVLCSFVVAMLSIVAVRWLSQPAALRMVPDLVKVAGIARSFEPLIHYSEHGVAQVGDLQAMSIAVWDLSESVRTSNLTSAPILMLQLDDLSESLKSLAMELTKFFANVDGDIDGILIVMDWARRELLQLQIQEQTAQHATTLSLAPVLTSAYDNLHNLLSSVGLLENTTTGQPTSVGAVTTALFGLSSPQRTRATLRRTFYEFLAILEEAVSSELQLSLALFSLFEAVDHQFDNLGRTAAREASLQDDRHADFLARLWTRMLGPNAAELKKYEQNRQLLRDVRTKTVRSKGILIEHNHKLLALKASLESVRRKLVSPLVQSVNSSTLTLEEQVRGLGDVSSYLEGVRARQKEKLMEMVYGSGRSLGIDSL